MKALSLVVSEKKIFFCFTHDPSRAGPVWTPGARLAGFIKRTTIHCYWQNMKALGLVVSDCKSMGANDPGAGPFLTPGAWFFRIYKKGHYTLLHTKYEGSGPCGFGEDFFYVLPHHAPGVGPVWTLGARLAGFIKRTTIHCYTQNLKGLGLVVSEKKIFLCFSHCKSIGAICCHGNQSSNPTWPKT